jgi:hypothetical protein
MPIIESYKDLPSTWIDTLFVEYKHHLTNLFTICVYSLFIVLSLLSKISSRYLFAQISKMLCWLLRTSVLKMSEFDLHFCILFELSHSSMNGMHEYFVCLHVCVQAETPFIFSFSGRREGGSSFQAAQKHVGIRNSISSGSMIGHLKHSCHSSVLVM